MSLSVVGLGALLAFGAAGAEAQELRNWFNDPFIQLSAEAPDCPTPAGPFVSEADRLLQSHRRAEKGTTAWLAGEADKPKAYSYDQGIADALRARFEGSSHSPGTSLWATVQGRVVYIEGCVTREAEISTLEALARSVPNVQQAVAIVRVGPAGRVPYKRLPVTAASEPAR